MFKPSKRLIRNCTRSLDVSPPILKDRLEYEVEPLLQRYPFVSKLSGGGVVVRVLKTPPTSRALWGRVVDDSFHVVRIPRGEDLSPWAPIVHGTIHPDGEGSRVEMVLRPHPSARTLAGLYSFFGLLLLPGSALAVRQDPGIAAVGVIFGLLLLFFPSFRARRSFEIGCDLVLESFDAAIAQPPPTDTEERGS